MDGEVLVVATLSVIPEDSAESQTESTPTSPIPKAFRKVKKGAEMDSASFTSTRRSSLRTPSYSQFEGLTERVSERVDKENSSCACQVF